MADTSNKNELKNQTQIDTWAKDAVELGYDADYYMRHVLELHGETSQTWRDYNGPLEEAITRLKAKAA